MRSAADPLPAPALAVLIPFFQQFTGINTIMFYASQLFVVLGAGQNSALLNTAIIGAVNVGSTIAAIVLVDRWGTWRLCCMLLLGVPLRCTVADCHRLMLLRADKPFVKTILLKPMCTERDRPAQAVPHCAACLCEPQPVSPQLITAAPRAGLVARLSSSRVALRCSSASSWWPLSWGPPSTSTLAISPVGLLVPSWLSSASSLRALPGHGAPSAGWCLQSSTTSRPDPWARLDIFRGGRSQHLRLLTVHNAASLHGCVCCCACTPWPEVQQSAACSTFPGSPDLLLLCETTVGCCTCASCLPRLHHAACHILFITLTCVTSFVSPWTQYPCCLALQAITTSVNFIFSFVIGQVYLTMLCHLEFGTYIFFAFWVAVMTLYAMFFLPETKGVPVEEMGFVWR